MQALSATRLALGGAQFGLDYGIANRTGRPSADETRQILDLARSRGMRLIDTAAVYGDSERRLGEKGLQGWQVVTKIPAVPGSVSDVGQWVNDSVETSLARLGIPSLYGLLLHRPQQLMGPMGASLYAALVRLKERRLATKIGVSIYDPSELDQLMPRFAFDMVQAPFNVLDRRLLDSSWLHRLPDRGVELHVRSVFLQGLLLMSPESRPPQFSSWDGLWRAWERWLQESGATALQACLNHVLSFGEIAAVVLGVESAVQLQGILSAIERDLPRVPQELQCADPRLIDPSRWNELQ